MPTGPKDEKRPLMSSAMPSKSCALRPVKRLRVFRPTTAKRVHAVPAQSKN